MSNYVFGANQVDQRTPKVIRCRVSIFVVGNQLALAFWNGFDGVSMGTEFTTRAERSSSAYACWRAGQDCKKLDPMAQATT